MQAIRNNLRNHSDSFITGAQVHCAYKAQVIKTAMAKSLLQSIQRRNFALSSSPSGYTHPACPSKVLNMQDIPGTRMEDAYVLQFTCKKCDTKSAKKISKHAYHKGVVIVTCGGCENRHLIADNMGWFEDDVVNVETMMKERGEEIKKSLEGDEGLLTLELEGAENYQTNILKE